MGFIGAYLHFGYADMLSMPITEFARHLENAEKVAAKMDAAAQALATLLMMRG